jgi:hypothetical protein
MAIRSKYRLLTAGALIILGRIILMFSLFFLAEYVSFGYPRIPLRCSLFLLVGLGCAVTAQRLTPDGWASVTQLPHQSAALAGVLFIGIVFKYVVTGKQIHLFPAGLFAAISGLMIVSWFLRSKLRPHHT